MEKIRFYDEAAHLFYKKNEFSSYPITSLDLFAPYFESFCGSLRDSAKLEKISQREKWKNTHNFQNEFLDREHVVLVTDSSLNIVYASESIYFMNGYKPHEIIGKKPKMFQGRETCKKTTKEVSVAIQNQRPFEVVLTNYRKNGTAYQCWIKGYPVLDASGKLVNFIAFEKEVA